MNPWGAIIGTAIGAGAGMFKAQEDQNKYMEQKNEQAALARLSPWTRLAVTDPGGRPSQIAPVTQGAAAGGQMGSGMNMFGSKKPPQVNNQTMAVNYSRDNAYGMA